LAQGVAPWGLETVYNSEVPDTVVLGRLPQVAIGPRRVLLGVLKPCIVPERRTRLTWGDPPKPWLAHGITPWGP
jgi:hypothetical protein